MSQRFLSGLTLAIIAYVNGFADAMPQGEHLLFHALSILTFLTLLYVNARASK